MNKFLTSIDLFGEPVKLYINKKAKIDTPLGGILSIIMFIIIIILSWFIGKDIVIKENPNSYEQKLASSIYPKIEMNEINFPIAVSILDFNNAPIMDDRYFELKLYYTMVEPNETNIFESRNLMTVNFEKCEYKHFPKLTKEQFDHSQLINHFCIKKQNFTLEGFWGERKVLYLNLEASMCDYDTRPDYCKSHNEIVDYIVNNGANFNIFYVEAAVDIKNHTNPIEYYLNSVYTYFDTKKRKILEYFLEFQSLVTDAGFVFENKQTENYFELKQILADTTDFSYDQKLLISFIIYSGNKFSIINRKYIKVAEILASVGGLFKIISLIFTIGNLGFSRVKKFETIINQVFDFNLNSSDVSNNCNSNNLINKYLNTKSQNITKDTTKNIELFNQNYFKSCRIEMKELTFDVNPDLSAYHSPTNISLSLKNEINISKFSKDILKNLKRKKEKKLLEFTLFEVITILCQCCCIRKLKHYSKFETYLKGESKIKDYFDFVNIIIHLEEFEALKRIIFNENQKTLFEMNINPQLNEDKKENVQNFNEQIDKNVKQFLDRINEGKYSETDDNLLKYLLNKS